MSRVPLTEVIFKNGNPVSLDRGAPVFIYKRGTEKEQAILYASETGEATVEQPLTTDEGGRPERAGVQPWLEPGAYEISVKGVLSPFQVAPTTLPTLADVDAVGVLPGQLVGWDGTEFVVKTVEEWTGFVPPLPHDRSTHLVGDMHFKNYGDRYSPILADLAANPLEVARRIQVGDQTHNARTDQDAEAIPFLQELTALDQAPLTITAGNHDIGGTELRTISQWATAYSALGAAQNFVQDWGYATLISVACDSNEPPRTLPQTQIEYLDAQLAAAGHEICIVLCHYPLYNTVGRVEGGEEQYRTDVVDTGDMPLYPDKTIRAVLQKYTASKKIVWVSGHTHSYSDALGLMKTHYVGDYGIEELRPLGNLLFAPAVGYADAITRAYPNLLSEVKSDFEGSFTGWSNTVAKATKNNFEASATWAKHGSKSLYFKATATEAGATALFGTSPALTGVKGGERYSVSVPVNVIQKGVLGPKLKLLWRDSEGGSLRTDLGSQATSTGEATLVCGVIAPVGAFDLQIVVGNFSTSPANLLANGEVLEMYADYIWLSSPEEEKLLSETSSDFEEGSVGEWLSVKSSSVILNDFSVSATWAKRGTHSLHYKVTAGATSQVTGQIQSLSHAVEPGQKIAVAVPMNLISKGAKGPRVSFSFLDDTETQIPEFVVGGSPIGTTGETVLTLQATVPENAFFVKVSIGNSTTNNRYLEKEEVLEFYVDDIQFAKTVEPPEGGSIVHINAGAIAYLGKHSNDGDPIRTYVMTILDEEVILRCRDHELQEYVSMQDQLALKEPLS